MSWDGAPDWVIDRLLAERRLPNLAALAARGAAADYTLSSFPSKTAAAHAALWTGCWSDCNGVVDNSVPSAALDRPSLLDWSRGFSSSALTAEPLYLTAALADRSVAVLSATQSFPPAPHLAALREAGVPADRLRVFSGFEKASRVAGRDVLGAGDLRPAGREWETLGPDHVGPAFEAERWIGGSRFRFFVFDDPEDPVEGLDRVLIRQERERHEAGPATAVLAARPAPTLETSAGEAIDRLAGWSPPFELRRREDPETLIASTHFRLFALAPDGSDMVLYQRQASALRGAFSDADGEAYRQAYDTFYDEAFGTYLAGRLGQPMMAGGDGAAERRMLELVAFDVAGLVRGTRFAFDRWRPDVLFHYSPMTDAAGHAWVGLLDHTGPAFDRGVARQLWPVYARVFELLDVWLGAIVGAAPPETAVALATDHGMGGVNRYLYLNRALADAGLLAYDEAGEIDLSRTRVLAPRYSAFLIQLNDTEWRGGIVADGDREEVLRQAEAALRAVRDPETGAPVVRSSWRAAELAHLGVGGARGGDLYFDLAPGYYPKNGFAENAVTPSRWPWGEGGHGFYPWRRDMHGIFYLAGPGVRSGVAVPAVRLIDVAPTLAYLLGIPAPASSRGVVLVEMLE